MNTKRFMAVIMVFLMLVVSSACSANGKPTTTESATKPTVKSTAAVSTTEAPDPFGKYEPPVEITAIFETSSVDDPETGFGPDNKWDDNVWTKACEEQLGIKIKYSWMVDSSQVNQKLSVSLASNDLPDIIPADVKLLDMLLEADAIADLADAYNQYASPFLKQVMTDNHSLELSAATMGNKIMGICPNPINMLNAPVLWVRKDWLNKLNLPEPRTMQDVLAISNAFANSDPDGNKVADTVGLGIQKQFFPQANFADTKGFFAGYHAYPYYWVKDDSTGKLVYGAVQPQVKDALAQLREMYKEGQIDKEFGVKNMSAVAEATASGKVGMQYGLSWNCMYPLNSSQQNDPNADWMAYPLPSIDNKPAKSMVEVGGRYLAVNKNCKHPEALIKIYNLFLEKIYGETAEPLVYSITPEGYMIYKLALVNISRFDDERLWFNSIHDAFTSNDKSKLIDDKARTTYDKIAAYKNGDTKGNWDYFRFYDYDTGSVGIVLKNYVDGDNLTYNQFYGANTPTMAEKWQTLVKMQDEVFTNIVIGAPMSDFDKFINDWKSIGGDAITKEVNDWYAAKQ